MYIVSWQRPESENLMKIRQNNDFYILKKQIEPKKLGLGEGFEGFRPQIRILHEISSLELAPNVRNPESRSKCDDLLFFGCVLFLNLFMGLPKSGTQGPK